MTTAPTTRKERDRSYYQRNRKRRLAWQKAYREANLEERRDYDRKRYAHDPASRRKYTLRQYGLTEEDYGRLLAAQGHRCGLCFAESCASGRSLCVDHDHDTGVVRGLLCLRCNSFVGQVEKDVERAHRAMAWALRGTDVVGKGRA